MNDLVTSAFSGLSPAALVIMIAGLFLASLARGYSGFGFSAVLVASWSLAGQPVRAVVLALVMEVTASILQAVSVWRDVPWKRVALLLGGAAVGTPVGVQLLTILPEPNLRLGIAGFVLISALALMSGWKLKRKAAASSTTGVGILSGICNGAVAMGGLPVALFLTADGDSPQRIRAAVVAYFFLLDIMGLFWLTQSGIATPLALRDAVLALPVLVIGMWLGTRHFLGATPEGFRRVTLILLASIALLTMLRVLIGL